MLAESASVQIRTHDPPQFNKKIRWIVALFGGIRPAGERYIGHGFLALKVRTDRSRWGNCFLLVPGVG
jgi:hypothetical protein